jgi:hypothetical protein
MAPAFLDEAVDEPRPNQGYRSQAILILPDSAFKTELFCLYIAQLEG